MKEAFEKIIERLEESGKEIYREPTINDPPGCSLIPTGEKDILVSKAIEIVNQVAEKFGGDINVGSNDGWISVENEVPTDDRYVLLSFENFSVPQIGRYHADEDGGAFYLGDEEVPLTSYDMFVNAWMELPKCYREE